MSYWRETEGLRIWLASGMWFVPWGRCSNPLIPTVFQRIISIRNAGEQLNERMVKRCLKYILCYSNATPGVPKLRMYEKPLCSPSVLPPRRIPSTTAWFPYIRHGKGSPTCSTVTLVCVVASHLAFHFIHQRSRWIPHFSAFHTSSRPRPVW